MTTSWTSEGRINERRKRRVSSKHAERVILDDGMTNQCARIVSWKADAATPATEPRDALRNDCITRYKRECIIIRARCKNHRERPDWFAMRIAMYKDSILYTARISFSIFYKIQIQMHERTIKQLHEEKKKTGIILDLRSQH